MPFSQMIDDFDVAQGVHGRGEGGHPRGPRRPGPRQSCQVGGQNFPMKCISTNFISNKFLNRCWRASNIRIDLRCEMYCNRQDCIQIQGNIPLPSPSCIKFSPKSSHFKSVLSQLQHRPSLLDLLGPLLQHQGLLFVNRSF